MNAKEMLEQVTKDGASDIFVVAGLPITYKVHNNMRHLDDHKLMPEDTENVVTEIYDLAGQRSMKHFKECGDDDFSFSIPGVSRFRVSTFKQRGSFSAVIRVIAFSLPSPSELNVPDAVVNLANTKSGLVLVTGPAGGGKSTTLACIIDKINREEEDHIITLEDPLEFLHRHEKSIVSQREVSSDTESYLTALRAALRQSPDVLLLGEMRDYETISVAMTAAETGHLIFSTLHTIGAANTIDRIIDAFPSNQQHQVSVQLSMVLSAVVSQQLVPTVDGKLIPAFEIMMVTPAIRNLIREGKIHQIDDRIATSSQEGMIAMDTSLRNLYEKGVISKKVAIEYASNPEIMEKKLV
ncbi:MAG: PilT/PilU family type 4a pilus ATPase [Lachnospiraceae bacterium]|nr:PilT/PilU family type 4a pilus ATPase [Lachnospiraceae bacterium]